MLETHFFARKADVVAQSLLGKVIVHRVEQILLCAKIIETEAYFIDDKASHASLGYTEKRKALFMPPGTIYMYYARGGDSFNISVLGEGNAVLIKSAVPYLFGAKAQRQLQLMQRLNPTTAGGVRQPEKLMNGQTLLCKALNLKVPEWDAKSFCARQLYIKDIGYQPEQFIQAKRLGIPTGRDEDLLYRFIDYAYANRCCSNPLTKRKTQEGIDYRILD